MYNNILWQFSKLANHMVIYATVAPITSHGLWNFSQKYVSIYTCYALASRNENLPVVL